MANRFLAGMSPFIRAHLADKGVENLVVDNFRLFFRRNVSLYRRPDLTVSAVGSIAFYYEEQLRQAARLEGYEVVKVIKQPMDELVKAVG